MGEDKASALGGGLRNIGYKAIREITALKVRSQNIRRDGIQGNEERRTVWKFQFEKNEVPAMFVSS